MDIGQVHEELCELDDSFHALKLFSYVFMKLCACIQDFLKLCGINPLIHDYMFHNLVRV